MIRFLSWRRTTEHPSNIQSERAKKKLKTGPFPGKKKKATRPKEDRPKDREKTTNRSMEMVRVAVTAGRWMAAMSTVVAIATLLLAMHRASHYDHTSAGLVSVGEDAAAFVYGGAATALAFSYMVRESMLETTTWVWLLLSAWGAYLWWVALRKVASRCASLARALCTSASSRRPFRYHHHPRDDDDALAGVTAAAVNDVCAELRALYADLCGNTWTVHTLRKRRFHARELGIRKQLAGVLQKCNSSATVEQTICGIWRDALLSAGLPEDMPCGPSLALCVLANDLFHMQERTSSKNLDQDALDVVVLSRTLLVDAESEASPYSRDEIHHETAAEAAVAEYLSRDRPRM